MAHCTREELELYRSRQMSLLKRIACAAHLKECPECARLLRELDESVNRLEYLMAAINHTNDTTEAGGMTLTQLIAKKDALMLRMAAYKDLVQEAGYNTSRARGTEIKVIPTMKTAALQKEVDRMAKEVRQLDNLLQETNWTKDLAE